MGCFEDYMDFRNEVQDAVKAQRTKGKTAKRGQTAKMPQAPDIQLRSALPPESRD